MSASLTIKTNLDQVLSNLGQSLKTIIDPNYLLRPVAIEVLPMMTERIHKEGKASDGGQIGTYSKGYMVVRTGSYKNAVKTKKGKTKSAGAFTRGAQAFSDVATKKANVRPNYNRSDDTKIIVSLTRQLENNWSVLETKNGYGIGFTNPFNAQKLRWVEEIKGGGPSSPKLIGNLTTEEIDYAFERVNELVENALNDTNA